jgi:putative addiction module killer protein
MLKLRKTEAFAKWIDDLRDIRGKARILVRIERLAAGNPGDSKPIGSGISEMRIDCGPGYRVYFTQRSKYLIVLLAGGDKSSQRRDIRNALKLVAGLEETL